MTDSINSTGLGRRIRANLPAVLVVTPLAVAAALAGGFYESTYSLLAAGVWLAIAIAAAMRPAPRPPLVAWLLLGLAAWSALSAWWGSAGAAFRVVPLVLLYAGAAYAAAWVEPERLLRAVLAVCALVVAIGVIVFAAGAAPDAAGPASDRLAWPIGYANGLGGVAAAVILLAAGLRAWPAAVVGGVALALTYSRSAILAAAAGALVLVAFRVRIARPAAVVAALVVAAVAVALAQPLAARFAAPAPDERDARRLLDVSGHGRAQLWAAAWDQARGHPLAGEGAGTWPRAYIRETGSLSGPANAHSLYLETLGELGVVGLALVVAIVGVVLRAGVRLRGLPWAHAALAVIAATFVQAAADWTWQLPAAALPAILAAGALARDNLSQSPATAGMPGSGRPEVRDNLSQASPAGASARRQSSPVRDNLSQAPGDARDNSSLTEHAAIAFSAVALLLGAAAGLHGVGAALVETGVDSADEAALAAVLLPGDARPYAAYAETQRARNEGDAARWFRRACGRDHADPALARAHPSFGGCRLR